MLAGTCPKSRLADGGRERRFPASLLSLVPLATNRWWRRRFPSPIARRERLSRKTRGKRQAREDLEEYPLVVSKRARKRGASPQRALVQACRGVPELSQTAVEVARRLQGMGAIATAIPPEEPAPAMGEGTVAVALDGCGAACTRRALEAQGLATTSIVLEELEDDERPLAERVMARLGSPPLAPRGRRSRTRPPRPKAPASTSRVERAHSLGDYLRALYALSSPVAECGAVVHDAPALAAHLAAMLGVSRPTGGEMLRRLEEGGLVRRGPSKEVLLTDKGRALAERAVRRQRVLERFVVDFLGGSVADCAGEASALEAAMDGHMVERIYERLGRPERCPHGWPVDPARERQEQRSLVALSAVAAGEEATVVALAETDDAVVGWLVEQGLAPGAELSVLERGPGGEPLVVLVCGERRFLGRAPAQAVLVHRREPRSA
ncbi:MAG: hypothetical protein C4306_04450 [Thermoleophilia bacterium]